MGDNIRIITLLKDLGILINELKNSKKEIKIQESTLLSMSLLALGASFAGNMLTRKGVMRAVKGVLRAGKRYSVSRGKWTDLGQTIKTLKKYS